MNIIENGNFESPSIAPWTHFDGAPYTGKIVEGNNKKRITIAPTGNAMLCQVFPIAPQPWADTLELILITKAIAAGGTDSGEIRKLTASLVVWVSLQYPEGGWSGGPNRYIPVTLQEERGSFKVPLRSAALPLSGEIFIANRPTLGDTPTDILVTDISLRAVS